MAGVAAAATLAVACAPTQRVPLRVAPASSTLFVDGEDRGPAPPVIELRADGATENTMVTDADAWQQFSALPAVRTGRVHVLTGSELVVPGPQVAKVTTRLAQLLHPEAFEPR